MKRWMQKLVEQLSLESFDETPKKKKLEMSEDRATLLYVLDIYSKHLVEIEGHLVRKTREDFDALARELVAQSSKADPEKLLFRIRQVFSGYRVDEYTYVRKTFEDFKGILWDFVEQLADDVRFEQVSDKDVQKQMKELKEAVESESIDILRHKSREFIDSYVEFTTKKNQRRVKKINSIKKSLDSVKKKLVEADRTMRTDHLTGAFNRKSFDEQVSNLMALNQVTEAPVSLCILDIDHFKKVNDTFGHDIGDFVLKECVRILQEKYSHPSDFVSRIGGEEFAILIQDANLQEAEKRAKVAFDQIRSEVFIHEGHELRFTVSMGIAQLSQNETKDEWIKRADQALYEAKHGGRNRWILAPPHGSAKISKVSAA